MIAIFKREMRAYFTSPLGYVFIAVCVLTSGLLFWLFSLASGSTDLSGVFVFMFFVLMVFVPILTMRLLSEERKQKTDQLIMTAPLSTAKLVIGKFLSAYAMFLLGTFVMFFYGVVLSFFAQISWMTHLGNCVGLMLLGGVFVSLGLFISALTENQMIAAVGGIFCNFAIFLFNLIASVIPVEFISDMLRAVSVYDRFTLFTLGLFSVSNLVFFVTVIAAFVFLTIMVLERRRWN
jgi:ABC-2 type transport system permease protein